jgi:hypothetical protein
MAVDQARVDALIDEVRTLFPEFAFFFDEESGGYGEDVRNLLLKAVLENYTDDRFRKEYRSTAYYNETEPSVRAWNEATTGAKNASIDSYAQNIRDTFGDLFTDDKALRTVAEKAARLGLKDNRLKNFVFSQAATTDRAQADFMETSEADRVRRVAMDYGYNPSETEITSILTGQPEEGVGVVLTEQQLRERAKMSLMGEMPHLKSQLDAGLTLKSMFTNYQREAADVLGVDPNSIQMSDPKYRQAFAYRDPDSGQVRQLSLVEWRQQLRSDPTYGYQYTPQANKDATDIALSIARAFGRMQ